ncbi:hypothetical protein Geob_0970 [Geotalea daltonii FRC-32]|uniref:YXWGXW repeat-containing protein n=1 Tax=Geotalea daltonii (strain DSM 22248 / JCM 15807 / FRC-32) TaxID=316067 RepID=B9M2F3_GEODF|nr:hypothetical protein [Geotalea daltonii]ACM19332.1 hypothetical protein Geob_0970 [Geotalea daltonii FRC-32]
MKKSVLAAILLALAIAVPIPAMAGINVNVGISLPPLIAFSSPPEVLVIPETTGVYVVPDVEDELFFWNGWWWRPWDGRWYRSRAYNRGWVYYNSVPSFYYDVDPGWRTYYRDRNWYGHRWKYKRIPHGQLQQNWKSWNKARYWERHGNWGVQSYRPAPRQQRVEIRQERQRQYLQRPEVQRHRQQSVEQQRAPQPRKEEPRRMERQRQPQEMQQQYQRPEVQYQQRQPRIQQQPQPQAQQPQRQEQQRHYQPRNQRQEGRSEPQRHEGRPDGGNGEHRR